MNYELHNKARKKVRSLRRLYIHMSLYVVLGIFFFLLNTITSPFQMWWFFPMLPWGVIVTLHYILVKGIPGTDILSIEWEEREYERQIERLEEDYKHPFLDEANDENYLPYRELSREEVATIRKGLVD